MHHLTEVFRLVLCLAVLRLLNQLNIIALILEQFEGDESK